MTNTSLPELPKPRVFICAHGTLSVFIERIEGCTRPHAHLSYEVSGMPRRSYGSPSVEGLGVVSWKDSHTMFEEFARHDLYTFSAAQAENVVRIEHARYMQGTN